MKVLVTGANGYIGMRLIRSLLDAGHEITAVVRDRRRFPVSDFATDESRLRVIEADFLDASTLQNLPPRLKSSATWPRNCHCSSRPAGCTRAASRSPSAMFWII